MLANIWSLWSEVRDMRFVDIDGYVLSWSAKWLDEKTITTKSLPDYKGYKKDPTNDKKLLEDMWKLLDEADVVIGHNAVKFDVRKLNARFILNGMLPPSPYRMIDTLKAAKAHFAFSSNKLDSLGELLGVGRKVEHEGFELWRKCMNGDKTAWKNMCKYNEQDVLLLEKVYLKLRPFIKNHPNITLDGSVDERECPVCGSNNLVKRGYAYTNASKFSRYRCKDCGKWSRNKINDIPRSDRSYIGANIM
jgi:DNA-directed RNA polymerase subunit RPC12/RpoP